MRISDLSSDVFSSDLPIVALAPVGSVGRGTLWQRLLAVLYQRPRCLPAPLVSKPAAANAQPANTARPVPKAGAIRSAGRPGAIGRLYVSGRSSRREKAFSWLVDRLGVD